MCVYQQVSHCTLGAFLGRRPSIAILRSSRVGFMSLPSKNEGSFHRCGRDASLEYRLELEECSTHLSLWWHHLLGTSAVLFTFLLHGMVWEWTSFCWKINLCNKPELHAFSTTSTPRFLFLHSVFVQLILEGGRIKAEINKNTLRWGRCKEPLREFVRTKLSIWHVQLRICALFSVFRNLIIHLFLNFLPKLQRNEETLQFCRPHQATDSVQRLSQ